MNSMREMERMSSNCVLFVGLIYHNYATELHGEIAYFEKCWYFSSPRVGLSHWVSQVVTDRMLEFREL